MTPAYQILPLILTKRLELRVLCEDHASAMMEARIESFEQLKKWDIFVPEPSADMINLADEMRMCRWRIDRLKQRESIFYSLFRSDDRRFIGCCSLTHCDWQARRAMIGFWIRSSETGKGYATEAATTVLDYGQQQLGLAIYSMHAQGNINSQAVLKRLGFHETSVKRLEHKLPDGRIVDGIYYELKAVGKA